MVSVPIGNHQDDDVSGPGREPQEDCGVHPDVDHRWYAATASGAQSNKLGNVPDGYDCTLEHEKGSERAEATCGRCRENRIRYKPSGGKGGRGTISTLRNA